MKLLSNHDIRDFFFICIFPINFWAIFVFFNKFPSFFMQIDLWQIIGILSYQLMFALLESITLTFLISLSYILLRKFYKWGKVLLATLILFTFIWLIPLHFYIYYLFRYRNNVSNDISSLMNESMLILILWVFTFFVVAILLINAFNKSASLRNKVDKIIERFYAPSTFFLGLDILGVIIVFIRNINPR